MCQKFHQHLNSAELATVLAKRHSLDGHEHTVRAAILECLEAERERLRSYIAGLENKDALAFRLITKYLEAEIAPAARR